MLKILKYTVIAKFFAILLSAWAPFSGAHSFRQNDTMGVTIRYWLRWFHEETLQHPFLPAVLSSGDAYGISPMEFPLLNLLTAPAMIFGTDYGRFIAKLMLFALNLALIYWHHKVWREKSINGVKVSWTSWLLIIFSTMHVYIDKFIPDPTAFLLMSLAVGYSWEKVQPKKSFFLALLGILIKPPVVFAFGLFFIRDLKTQGRNLLAWALPAVAISVLYYTYGIKFLSSLSDIPQVFAVAPRNPLESLSIFFQNPVEIMKLISKTYFTKFLIVFMMIDLFRRRKDYRHYRLWAVLLVQTLAAAALVGGSGFNHEYYYIGTAFICCFLFKDFLLHAPKTMALIAVCVLAVHTLERSFYSIRPIFRNHEWHECREINKVIPKNEIKVSSEKVVGNALIGVCLGKIEGSETAPFIVHLKNNQTPPPQGAELIMQTERFLVYQR